MLTLSQLIVAAHAGFPSPIFFRQVVYNTARGMFHVASWNRVHVNVGPRNKNVYVLPPVPSAWMESGVAVPYIVKLERIDEDTYRDDLVEIAPFKALEEASCGPIK